MSSSPRTNVLSERDPNVPQSPEKNKKGDGKQQDMPKSLEYHRQALEARLKESQSVNTAYTKKTSQQPSAAEDNEENAASFSSETPATLNTSDCSITYISPSDNIMSPATAKLAAFKNRHVKSVKPRTLFAKTTSNNAGLAAAKQSEQSSADNS